jgi:hypothetical protein
MMNRNVSGLANLILMVLMLAGVLLANYSDSRLLVGLLLAFGAAAGIIVLARRENSLPLGHGEREGWRILRAKGKRHYVLRSVMYGLFVGLVFLLHQVIRSLWSGEPFTASSGFLLVVLFIILYIGGSYYAAIKKWALYEERYKDSLPTSGAA